MWTPGMAVFFSRFSTLLFVGSFASDAFVLGVGRVRERCENFVRGAFDPTRPFVNVNTRRTDRSCFRSRTPTYARDVYTRYTGVPARVRVWYV